MGWWRQDKQGHSFADGDEGIGVWGDGPADIVDNAVDRIVEEFERVYDRRPTGAELRAGFLFSLGGYEDGLPREGDSPVPERDS